MGELLAFSPSISPPQRCLPIRLVRASLPLTSPISFLSTRMTTTPISYTYRKQNSLMTKASVASDRKPTTFTPDSGGDGIDILPDSGGPNDNLGGTGGNNGGGGGGGGDKNEGGSDENEDQSGGHKKDGMSMSQKLTLGYAALVGIGGLMGYLKGGSTKSLLAGGLSASLLYYVYSVLPSNPVWASSVGLVLSAALLGVMGSRFKKSGKVFPAGVVSFVSLVMTGGYLHGILRSLH